MILWVDPTEKKLSLRDFHSEIHGFAFFLFSPLPSNSMQWRHFAGVNLHIMKFQRNHILYSTYGAPGFFYFGSMVQK